MSISKSKRNILVSNSPNNCWYCGVKNPSTVDHVIPKSLGGNDDLDNLVLACKSCNSRKKDMPMHEFKFKSSWDKTHYSKHINHIIASSLMGDGVIFEGFKNDHKFWFEG